MEIRKVVPSGYCKGVVNAIRLAKKTREENPGDRIYVLGMLVHNSYVSKELTDLGIVTLDDTYRSRLELLDEIEDGIVIFTAHGTADPVKEKAKAKGLRCVDATCVDVLKTQNIIREYLDKDYDVIYFGKKKHPEAEAVLSMSNRIHLITCEDDLQLLQIDNDRIFLTNQTTMSYLELADLTEAAKARYPGIVMEKEICNATSSRQLAVNALEDCDLLYVVGDLKSNNTGKLADIGRKKGIRKVFLIQSYKDIDLADLKDAGIVYVTAGASTPPKLIDEVISFLSSYSADQFTD